MYEKKPTPLEILVSLTENGELAEQLQFIYHERVHNTQRRLGAIFPPLELREAQAWRAVNTPPESGYNTADTIFCLGKNPKSLYHKAKEDRLYYSVQKIDELKAMGFDDREIGRIICDVRVWVNGMYPSLELAVKRKRLALGLTEKDLQNLVQLRTQERKIAKYKAQAIAQEEVEKLVISKAVK